MILPRSESRSLTLRSAPLLLIARVRPSNYRVSERVNCSPSKSKRVNVRCCKSYPPPVTKREGGRKDFSSTCFSSLCGREEASVFKVCEFVYNCCACPPKLRKNARRKRQNFTNFNISKLIFALRLSLGTCIGISLKSEPRDHKFAGPCICCCCCSHFSLRSVLNSTRGSTHE